jgi:phosphatidylglycerophosphate synthase
MANALSILRGLCAVPYWLATLPGGPFAGPEASLYAALTSAALLAFAIASDLADGKIARARGTASGLGRALDHGADVLFVLAGLSGAAARGAIPTALPVLVALAFAQYTVDSLFVHGERQLRMSRLGRSNGILYFVPLVGDVLVRLGLSFLALPLLAVAWALVATTLLSMLDRALALRRGRASAGASPRAG